MTEMEALATTTGNPNAPAVMRRRQLERFTELKPSATRSKPSSPPWTPSPPK
jgi:hypothetical protein